MSIRSLLWLAAFVIFFLISWAFYWNVFRTPVEYGDNTAFTVGSTVYAGCSETCQVQGQCGEGNGTTWIFGNQSLPATQNQNKAIAVDTALVIEEVLN